MTVGDLAGFDAVICLAALSNDPLGHLNPNLTYDINLNGTVHLATVAKAAGVERFVFASSCSLYGAAGSVAVGEDAEMDPVTPYGKTKALAEQRLSALADETFSPTFMRNATAYGASPRLRLDIVVNNLVGVAMSSGEVRLQSDGSPWRPLVHAQDISRAALAAVEAPRELVHNEAFNVGRDVDNMQVGEIADLVADALPGTHVTRAAGAGPDLRDYRVDFSKLHESFPALSLGWSVKQGIDELVGAYAEHGMSADDFTSSQLHPAATDRGAPVRRGHRQRSAARPLGRRTATPRLEQHERPGMPALRSGVDDHVRRPWDVAALRDLSRRRPARQR